MRCGALLLAVRYSYAIVRTILVQFLQFMRFGEHSYLWGPINSTSKVSDFEQEI